MHLLSGVHVCVLCVVCVMSTYVKCVCVHVHVIAYIVKINVSKSICMCEPMITWTALDSSMVDSEGMDNRVLLWYGVCTKNMRYRIRSAPAHLAYCLLRLTSYPM